MQTLHQFCCWYQGYTNQYEVYPPLALMTSLILLGMLSINSWHCATSILSHSTCIRSQSSNIPFGGSRYSASLLLRINQRCSIGLRSGDWGGHTMTSNSWSSNHFLAFLLVCLGSLSCWKIMSSWDLSKIQGFAEAPPPGSEHKGQHPSYLQFYMETQPLPRSYSPRAWQILLQTWLSLLQAYHWGPPLPFSMPTSYHLTQYS